MDILLKYETIIYIISMSIFGSMGIAQLFGNKVPFFLLVVLSSLSYLIIVATVIVNGLAKGF